MSFLLMERTRPLQMFHPYAVFLCNRQDMVVYVSLPCLLIGQQQFFSGGLVKGNHAAVHSNVLLGVLVYKPRNIPPVTKLGHCTWREFSKQTVVHALIFSNPRPCSNIADVGVVFAGCAFIIGIFETLLID